MATFAERCNTEMVDLDRLEDDDEVARVHELIVRHVMLTESAVGARVLDSWPSMLPRFVAVTPRDFKRIKAAEARARAESRGATFGELVEGLAAVPVSELVGARPQTQPMYGGA